MQHWITDDPTHFLRSMKTATPLQGKLSNRRRATPASPEHGQRRTHDAAHPLAAKENQAMRRMARIFIAMMLSTLAACTTGQRMDSVDASAWSANYTEDYIQDFWIQTADGKATGVGGVSVSEFSRGGTSGRICCSLMPGVGQTIKVVWRVGGHQEDESTWKAYSRDVEVKGAMPTRKDAYNILMVRFFPGQQVEAELIPDRGEPGGSASPRVDQLFYGRRVMRHIGE
ncbi:DUF3304 domain-containing protein [Paraburkholderia phenoliruptrix]|nr:DUF3304 domain-containing protein [Paraburkholderia phenoliruptrix]MDR6421781.1 hypothetical protein [Paraburkholderia phenoliruptrix]CAB4048196.1 hypothetical protein LMG9964_01830 [Paraburkholderia phenoliruptrix]